MANKPILEVYEREALLPPPNEDHLRRVYAVAFGWPAPEEYTSRDLAEALRRLLEDVEEET
jgi:hypothetical protein